MERGARAGLALAVIVVMGCTSPEGAPCTPGESRACACTSGAMGAQVCGEDGSGLGPCVCAETDGGELVDAGMVVEPDAGPLRHDAGARDAGHDAGQLERDAGRPDTDAGPPLECDLYSRELCGLGSQCGVGRTCRRSADDDEPRDNVETGPPECEDTGTILEHNYGFVGLCNDDTECQCGLFCNTGGECVRYCDLSGEACPDDLDGLPQHCVTEERGPGGTTVPVLVPYCDDV